MATAHINANKEEALVKSFWGIVANPAVLVVMDSNKETVILRGKE